MNIQDLSGNELDWAVQEHVFQHKWITTNLGKSLIVTKSTYDSLVKLEQYYTAGCNGKRQPTENYSGDDHLALRAADEVKLFERGYVLLMDPLVVAGDEGEPQWVITTQGDIYSNQEGIDRILDHVATGSTRAEVLSRAALALHTENR